MGSLGAPELLILLVVVLVLFGGAKLPQLARSLGQAKREFETEVKTPGPVGPADPTDR
jgi:sec-independent protein translocase protein TatA